jgi:LacI family transcriptional regulator
VAVESVVFLATTESLDCRQGQNAMALPEPPEAILAANNLIAIGVLQVLDELGDRSIGLSVIGDLPFATSRPPNTKIVPLNPRALGETAAQMLIERINGLRARLRAVVQPAADPEALSWP